MLDAIDDAASRRSVFAALIAANGSAGASMELTHSTTPQTCNTTLIRNLASYVDLEQLEEGMVMADDWGIRGSQDPTKVNVNEIWEVRYCCKYWGTTEQQLTAAVAAVGTSRRAVASHLGKPY